MSEKLDRHEVQREVEALIDSFANDEQRQIMASLAERYGFKITDKASTPRRGYRPGPARKRIYQ
jgi:hypothetical protein